MSETSKLTIGRKKDIDIKLSEDISVSRHHANLLYDF
jgi:pSer/pThr/pTyr-binding forkhead associated (FHA) protein